METAYDERATLDRWLSDRDEAAFRRIVERHGAMVYATCRRIVRCGADAEDLTQECFAMLLRMKKAPKAPLGPWLHRVATNLSLNHLRTQRRRAAREQTCAQPDSSEAVVPEDVWAHLDTALLRLPDRLRVPLVAHYLGGCSQESIAASIGISRQSVGYRIGKGLEVLRKVLVRQGIGVSTAGLGVLLGSARAEAAPLHATLVQRLAHLPSRFAASGGVAGTTAGYGILQWMSLAAVACGALLGTISAVKSAPPKLVRASDSSIAVSVPAAPAPRQKSLQSVKAVAAPSPIPVTPTTASISGHTTFPGWVPADGPVTVGALLRHKSGDTEVVRKEAKVGEEYRLEKLPPGDYKIIGMVRGSEVSVEMTLKAGDALQDVDLNIVSNNTVVCGFARDPDDQPVAGATVSLSTGVGSLLPYSDTVTDETGYFEIRHVAASSEGSILFNGPYTLSVFKEGYHSRYEPSFFDMKEGERLEANVVLVPGRYSLSGRVVTPTGLPAPGAEVGYGRQTTRSGPDGAFRLDHLFDKCEVSVQYPPDSPYYRAEPKKYDFQGGADEDGAVFTVWPGGSVVGRLASADGTPFPLESVQRSHWQDAKSPTIEKGKLYPSDTAFEFVGVPPGKCYVLAKPDASRAPALVGPFEVKPGERVDLGRIVFSSGGRIVGRLVFPPEFSWDDGSVSYMPLRPDKEGHFSEAVRKTTAAPGNGYQFELTGLTPGRGKLKCQGASNNASWGVSREVVVKEGETLTVELPITPPRGGFKPSELKIETGSSFIEGCVLWDNGAPVEKAIVRIDGRQSGVWNVNATTDPQGHFRLDGLDPKDVYKVKVTYGQNGEKLRDVHCGADLRITLVRMARVVGRLVGTDGRPVGHAQFSLIGGSERITLNKALVGADGGFVIEDMRGSGVDLLIEGTDYTPVVMRNLAFPPGQDLDLGTVTLDSGMDFSGRVLDEDGQPVPYAEVTAAPMSQGIEPKVLQRVVTADSHGRFLIAHAQEGPHHVTVTAPGYSPTETEADFRTDGSFSFTILPAPIIAIQD